MRQAGPKLDVSDTALFPTLWPSSQGEKASVAVRPPRSNAVHVFEDLSCAPNGEVIPLSKLADSVVSVGFVEKICCENVKGGKGALEDQ